MLGDLYKDPDVKYEYKLTLCKPNRKELVILEEAYNINFSAKFADIDELSFSIPKIIKDESTHNFIKNPNFDLIKGDFLILMETQNDKKYFIIDTPSEEGGEKDYKTVQCYSQEIELTKKNLRMFRGTRQLYNPILYYSFDNITWTKYTAPVNANGKTNIYVKTKDFSNSVDILANISVAIKNVVINGIGFDIHNNTQGNFTEIAITRSGETGNGILNEIENSVSWSIGYIDPLAYRDTSTGQQHNKYRTFDISEKTWLDVIKSEIETAYDCVCMFDTYNKKINIYHVDTLSIDKGIFISEDNFLKKINKEPKFGEIYTRLKIYGNNNISINSINPMGTDYVEDFSYYMNNDYMSDGLKTALTNYNTLLESKKTDFATYLSQLSTQNGLLTDKQTELATLQNELIIILDNIDLAIQNGTSLTTLNIQKANKQTEIDNKKIEISNVNTQITTINNNISTLAQLIDKKNNFTDEQLVELDYFTKEKSWQNNNYSNANELYFAGQEAIKKVNIPTISTKIDIVDLFNIVECQYEWDKLTLGSLINVHYSKLNIDLQLRLVAYQHQTDGGLTVELSNKDKKDSATRYLSDSISRAIDAGTHVELNKGIWDKSEGNGDWINEFINSNLDASKNAVLAGKNQSVRIDERGILMSDITNQNEQLRIINNCLAMTIDNWETASTAITPYGIIAKKLIGNIILGTKLNLADEKGQFVINGNLLKVIDNLNQTRVKLGEYENGKYGLWIANPRGDVVLSEDGMLSEYSFNIVDNVDSSHPLKVKFFINDNVLSVRQVKIAFSCELFRAYEKSALNGGNTSVSSENGGGDTYTNAGRTPYWHVSPIITEDASPDDPHYHFIDVHVLDHGHQIILPDHQHEVSLPAHSHGLNYGIYESTKAQGVNITIDGVLRDGNNYNSDQVLDVTQYIQTSGLHEIQLSSNQLGRISCTVYVKSFVAT